MLFSKLILSASVLLQVQGLKILVWRRHAQHLAAKRGNELWAEEPTFYNIASNFLISKFNDCTGGDGSQFKNRAMLERLLASIVPPTATSDFGQQLLPLQSNQLDSVQFVSAVLDNELWKSAGLLCVKELVYLDCLHNYYFLKKKYLTDEDYNELKDMLAWEGKIFITMHG